METARARSFARWFANGWWGLGLILGLMTLAGLIWQPAAGLLAQFEAGHRLQRVFSALPPESHGFACLADPTADIAERADLEAGIARLRDALAIFPRQAHLYYLLGRASCRLGDYEQAIQALQRFSDLRRRNPSGYLEMGFALERLCPPKGQCSNMTARKAWKRAGLKAQDFIQAGEAARKAQRYEEALEWYGRASALGANLESTRWYVIFQSTQDWEALEKSVSIDHGWIDDEMRPRAWLQWGAYLHDQQRDVEAEAVLERAIATSPESPALSSLLSEMYRFLGLSQAAQGKMIEAVQSMKRAVELNDRNTWAHIHYGKVLYFFDPHLAHQTEHEFVIALEQNPDVDIWRNLIGFWRWVGEIERANQMCDQATSAGLSSDLVQECSGQ